MRPTRFVAAATAVLGACVLASPAFSQTVPAPAPAGAAKASTEAKAVSRIARQLVEASDRIGAVTGREVRFEVTPFKTPSDPLVTQVADLTAQAFELKYRARAGQAMNLIERIVVQEAAQTGVEVQGSELRISVAPSQGAAGAPSLEEISKSLTKPTIRLSLADELGPAGAMA